MKILSKKEFTNLNDRYALKMSKDKNIQKDAINLLVKADKNYRWVHQNTWMGEPILNLPQDILVSQEIIFKTKPDYIIETGVAWGGSILFLASMLKVFGGKKVIGVDTFLPKTVLKAINKSKSLKKNITLIKGSSTDEKILKKNRKNYK